MNLIINGVSTTIQTTEEAPKTSSNPVSTSLQTVLDQYAATPPYAVAINGDFIPQSLYAVTKVNEDEMLDIVSPIFGG